MTLAHYSLHAVEDTSLRPRSAADEPDGFDMATQEWTAAIGLRRAALSLMWRTFVAALTWCALLWIFHAALDGIGVTSVPTLIALGFAALAGTIAGLILSRGLDEKAGLVSPLLTLMALAFAAVAIIGAEAMFERMFSTSTDHLRFVIVGATMIVAGAWIVRYTLLDG